MRSLWVAVMLQVFRRHTSRVKQFWGVKSNEEPVVQARPFLANTVAEWQILRPLEPW